MITIWKVAFRGEIEKSRFQEGIHHFQILSGHGKKILAENSGEI
jgi:hypothetical protein